MIKQSPTSSIEDEAETGIDSVIRLANLEEDSTRSGVTTELYDSESSEASGRSGISGVSTAGTA